MRGELGILDLGRASVVDCTSCEGIWLRVETFEAICRTARERPDVLGAEWKERPVREPLPEDVRYIPCPTCGELMNRRQFRYRNTASTVVVDLCRGHGIWLDAGELRQVVAFVRERASAGGAGEADDGEFLRGRPPTPEEKEWTREFLGTRKPRPTTVLGALELLGSILFGR